MIISAYHGNIMLSLLLVSTFLMNWIALLVSPESVLAARSTPLAKTELGTRSKVVSENRAIQSKVNKAYDGLPLSFETNLGQHPDPAVKYFSRARDYDLALTTNDAVFTLRNSSVGSANTSRGSSEIAPPEVLKMKLHGARTSPLVPDSAPLPGKLNYFLGNDPSTWRRNIPAFSRLMRRGVYKGIDIAYYGNQQQLEYDFIVAPGNDPSVITLEFTGLKSLRLNANGELILATSRRQLHQHKPRAFQVVDGIRHEISARTVIKGKRRVGFKLAPYDQTKELIIDPVLSYSTYIANGEPIISDMALDSAGNVYVVGWALASAFRAPSGSLKTFDGDFEAAFIAKLNASGTEIIYSSLLGGNNGNSLPSSIAIDSEGNAYISGTTNSNSFPTTQGAFQTHSHGTGNIEAFVAKLNPSGSGLIYSTYFGGGGIESCYEIAIDNAGDAYIEGATNSTDLPTTPSAFQPNKNQSGNSDSYVAKLDATGSFLFYCTYLGGTGIDVAGSIAVDQSGNAYLTGRTSSADFPTTAGSFQPVRGNSGGGLNYAAFVTKLNVDGSHLVYSSYLGDSSMGGDIKLDAAGNAYLTGQADSDSFPIVNALQTKLRGGILIKSVDGNSWTLAAAGLPRGGTISVNPVIDPLDRSRIYAAVYPGGLFRSTDSGNSWVSAGKGLPHTYFVASLVMDLTTHSTLYVGLGSSQGGSLYRSTDGGDSWAIVSADVSGFNVKIDPKTPSTLYAANNDQALIKSVDRGAHWSISNQRMPQGAQITDIAIDPKNPSNLYATTVEDVLKSTDEGNTWTSVGDVRGSNPRLAIDPTNTSTVYFVAARGDFDLSGVKGRGNPRKRAAQTKPLDGVCKSTDSGETWQLMNTGLSDQLIPYTLVIDPSDSSTIYLGAANGLYKSSDEANTWTRVDQFMSPTALAISPASDRTIYAANRAGGAEADAFVTKVNADGSSLIFSTLLGGLVLDSGGSITLDEAGNIFVVGSTESSDFPVTADALQRTHSGSIDVFVAKLDPSGGRLDYASYLGGTFQESPAGIALDSAGNIYVAGYTNSPNFPTVNAIIPTLPPMPRNRGAFISKISLSTRAPKGPTITNVTTKGKKLIVNGQGFGPGSQIFVKGEPQTTLMDEQIPGRLISKAAKRIARGESVMIQVRNSDGSLSNEFDFVRPVE